MADTCLDGETEIVTMELLALETKPDLHGTSPQFTPRPAVSPPSIRKSEPVTKPARGEAR